MLPYRKLLFASKFFLANSHHARNRLLLTPTVIECAKFSSEEGNGGRSLNSKQPSLQDFISLQSASSSSLENVQSATPSILPPYLSPEDFDSTSNPQKFFFEVYGCQMNVNDVEIARSILLKSGFMETKVLFDADAVLVMTCAIREGAEDKIWSRIRQLKSLRKRQQAKFGPSRHQMKIGILGCMAERLKLAILDREPTVDLIAGPDAYRDLPRLLATPVSDGAAMNVQLSLDETYADIAPVRQNLDSKTAYVSIMRGCDNMCTYCIVPFTRGRERSRPIDSILDEVRRLSESGVKEITLLGQNVNSYRDLSVSDHSGGSVGRQISHAPPDSSSASASSPIATPSSPSATNTVKGFKTVYKPKIGGRRFSDLLDKASLIDPEIRFRFTSPHPKDFPDEVLQLIAERPNICNQLHLPAQSGDNDVLAAMGRGYTKEAYMDLVGKVRQMLPDVCFTSDFIAGFCGETDEAHLRTLALIREVQYSFCYCFPYSMREKTRAHRRLHDDVPEDVKNLRAIELVKVFREEADKVKNRLVGSFQVMLAEKHSKRSRADVAGKTDGGVAIITPNTWLPDHHESPMLERPIEVGDYVVVKVECATSQSLTGQSVALTTLADAERTIQELVANQRRGQDHVTWTAVLNG